MHMSQVVRLRELCRAIEVEYKAAVAAAESERDRLAARLSRLDESIDSSVDANGKRAVATRVHELRGSLEGTAVRVAMASREAHEDIRQLRAERGFRVFTEILARRRRSAAGPGPNRKVPKGVSRSRILRRRV